MSFLSKVNTHLVRRPSTFLYQYFRRLAFDYRDALIDTGKSIVQHPWKTLFYSSNLTLLFCAYRTMPSFDSYRNALTDFEHQQMLTSKLIRNPQVENYVHTIEQLLLKEQIHFVDCYLFSLIIYRSQYGNDPREYRLYENLCSYLHRRRDARVIDIGLFNRWLILNRKRREADV